MSGRALTVVAVFGLSLLVGLPRAEAQRRRQPPAPPRAPAEGMWAVGGSAGVAAPTDDSLSTGFDLAGNVEGYLTSRVSVRAQVSGAWWDVVGRGFTGTVSPFVFDGNLVYNWEGGKVHPFVTGGVGAYHYGSHIDHGTDGGDTKFGGDFGGGVEVPSSRGARRSPARGSITPSARSTHRRQSSTARSGRSGRG